MRSRPSPSFALCLGALVAVLVTGCATAKKRDEPQVHSLKIEGTKQVKEGAIEKKLLTTPNSWIPFSRKQYFDEDEWKTDQRRIQQYYRAQGFYQAKVVESQVKPHGKEVDLVSRVEEGNPTHIASILVKGLDDLPASERKSLLNEVPLRVGQVFKVDRWEGLKAQMKGTLEELGYAAAKVQGEARVALDTQRADILVEVDHGPRYKFGALTAKQEAHARVESWRILEQAAAEVTPGDVYSVTAQNEAEARVFKMGVFGAVKLRPGTPDPSTLTVPMVVDVQESRFHTLGYGGGIAVDQTREELRATGQYVDRDFMGGLRRLTLNAIAGYAWIPTFYSTSASGAQKGPIGTLSADLLQPRLFFRDLNLDTKLTLEKGLEPAYSYYGGRAKVGLIWTPTAHLTISPSYNLEYYRLQSGAAQLTGTTASPTLLFGCPENCLLSYVEEVVTYDRRNDPQEPKKGYLLSLSLQEGGGPLGGSFEYIRIVPEARAYVSFLENNRLTFAGRLKAGNLHPTNGNDAASPIVARFYSGGDDMRGFNSRRLSPQVVVPVPLSTSANTYSGYTVAVGGDGLFESSFETRYNIAGPLIVAAFFDTGFVTREHFNLHDFHYFRDNLFLAVGGGIRYKTPLGPIRLDLGYRPDIGPPLPVTQLGGPTLTYATRSGCFGFGKGGPNAGSPEGPCVLHISIGEAF